MIGGVIPPDDLNRAISTSVRRPKGKTHCEARPSPCRAHCAGKAEPLLIRRGDQHRFIAIQCRYSGWWHPRRKFDVWVIAAEPLSLFSKLCSRFTAMRASWPKSRSVRNLDIGLIHITIASGAALVPIEGLQQPWREVDNTAILSGMINAQDRVSHHFSQIAQAQIVRQRSAYTLQNYGLVEMAILEHNWPPIAKQSACDKPSKLVLLCDHRGQSRNESLNYSFLIPRSLNCG